MLENFIIVLLVNEGIFYLVSKCEKFCWVLFLSECFLFKYIFGSVSEW